MAVEVYAIFDIGKTNKKFFMFNRQFQVVYSESVRFEDMIDEDGDPCENIEALLLWMQETINGAMASEEFEILALNFSTYGASLVHLGRRGELLTVLYDYMKPMDMELEAKFFKTYDSQEDFWRKTGSPPQGFLNSGLQLYWLKYAKPELFAQIAVTLHFPQYLSFIFTGTPLSEYSSIGCHTGLWHYAKKNYARWVYEEGLDEMLPPIISSHKVFSIGTVERRLRIGTGVHDSSAALVPYLRGESEPFILISTGTWSVSFNPNAKGGLTDKDIQNNCLNYMQVNGQAVKASRFMLGAEFDHQAKLLRAHFEKDEQDQFSMKFDQKKLDQLNENVPNNFVWEYIPAGGTPNSKVYAWDSFELAYHALLFELVKFQVDAVEAIYSLDTETESVIVEGGFSKNEIFMNMLAQKLNHLKVFSSKSTSGSALGAALLVADERAQADSVKSIYSLQQY